MIASHTNIRRWQRHPVEMPVRILPCSRLPASAVSGRGTGLSQGGMALYAGVDLEPDDLIEVEFPTPHPMRVMRIQELRTAADVAADKVRKTGTPYHFSPMSSRERRIVHLALRDESDLHTESEGEGPQRRLVVYPKDYKGAPGKPAPRTLP